MVDTAELCSKRRRGKSQNVQIFHDCNQKRDGEDNQEVKPLPAKQVIERLQFADLLGHSTSETTEMYYVKKDTARLGGITEGFEL